MKDISEFINRTLESRIRENLFKGKIVIIYGARQVGKTTMCKRILKDYPSGKYINCELIQNKSILEKSNDKKLKAYLGKSNLVILDEAQKVENIGLTLKIIADNFTDLQVIATGSSSFDLANKTAEPLTGRARRFLLYPLSVEEIMEKYDIADIEAKLENILRFGLYPGVFGCSNEEAENQLYEIASNYLYRDLFQFSGIRKPSLLIDILKALSLQLGNEVSSAELANLIGKNSHTVESYLDLLEQSFIIFRVGSFSRNLRKEIGKKYKIYFYDLGIRNSLIQNFNALEVRNDKGALWENFCILERIKANNNSGKRANYYFWRTYDQKEVDLVEERGGKLFGYDFKYNNKKAKAPKDWLETYENASFKVVNKDNYLDFITQ
ncbi:MAG: ATP-binding protein [Candidatus Moraniibacteriota bacterium]